MRTPRRLSVAIIPTATVYLTLANTWISVVTCIFLAEISFVLTLFLLPAVWSRRKYRREAAQNLVKLIIGSFKS
jgi:hypothetical protein